MSQKNSPLSVRDRARGMLVGLAVGDALGAPVEFGYTSQSIAALGDKIEHFQPSPLGPAGTWTDDTSMALCLADSLIEKNGYDSFDIMGKYRHWMLDGYRTCEGLPAADVGIQTRIALIDFADNPYISEDAPKTESAGNGAIMRLAPYRTCRNAGLRFCRIRRARPSNKISAPILPRNARFLYGNCRNGSLCYPFDALSLL